MKLFICGNGFDLHHGLPTSYDHYAKYLKEHHPSIFKEYNDFPYLHIPYVAGKTITPWSNIENSLTINYQDLMEDSVQQDYPDLLSDSDSRWSDMEVNIGILTAFIESFTGACFYEWLSQIDCSNATPDLDLPKSALYVSFNYTDTLQSLYGIDDKNVFHIHGALKHLVGTDINSDVIRDEIQFGSSELDTTIIHEELEHQFGDDDFYGASIEPAVNTLGVFIQKASKDLAQNYEPLKEFIADKDITEIVTMGHTLTEADFAYYRDVLIPNLPKVKWVFFHHNSTADIDRFLSLTGIQDYEIAKW